MEESFDIGKKSYGTETDTETWSWFQLPIPKPGFGRTLVWWEHIRKRFFHQATFTNDIKQNGVAVQILRACGTGVGNMGAIDIDNFWLWYDLLLQLALPNSLTIHRVWIFNVVIIISAPTSRRDMNERSSNSVSLKEKSHLMKLGLQCNLKSRKFLWKQRQRLPIMPKAKMPRRSKKVHFYKTSSSDVLW